TSLHIQPEKMEEINKHLQAKYKQIEKDEVRYEAFNLDDAEYVLTGYGLGARICRKAMDILREKGYKVGLVRPITLFPFPKKVYEEVANRVKGILDVEMNAGQMVEDVKLSVCGKTRVEYYGRMGGMIPSPEEIVENFEKLFIKGEA
ncbi:MAG TPA: 3-methyl-2-oxobutanoate dehydrogenase subunit beta, partial [Candidatus Kapabacteria bacterium]|nr:3-methyl-2-oxobutanoate dehydrogenase subunit beta [Candidatus Kapabacteria bacterium]